MPNDGKFMKSLARWKAENLSYENGKWLSTKVQEKIKKKTVIRPAMMYDLETMPLIKWQKMELGVAEMKILHFMLGVMRLDMIRMSPLERIFNLAGLEARSESRLI